MKKRITEHELLCLSDQALRRLTDWSSGHRDLQPCVLWKRRGQIAPLLSIGDMLEFLEEQGMTSVLLPGSLSQWCDLLWSITRDHLERE